MALLVKGVLREVLFMLFLLRGTLGVTVTDRTGAMTSSFAIGDGVSTRDTEKRPWADAIFAWEPWGVFTGSWLEVFGGVSLGLALFARWGISLEVGPLVKGVSHLLPEEDVLLGVLNFEVFSEDEGEEDFVDFVDFSPDSEDSADGMLGFGDLRAGDAHLDEGVLGVFSEAVSLADFSPENEALADGVLGFGDFFPGDFSLGEAGVDFGNFLWGEGVLDFGVFFCGEESLGDGDLGFGDFLTEVLGDSGLFFAGL